MIRSAEEIARLRDDLHAGGGRLVFTNGCFDLLHVGHVRYLAEARALGDALVVALNSDESVRALKGEGRPLNPVADRAEVLAALRSVDAVTVFDGERATGLIETVRPHVYAKGGDYTPDTLNPEERAALDSVGARIEILGLVPGKSTSATIAAMGPGDAAPKPFRVGVLGSGKGTNLAELFKALDEGRLAAAREIEIAIVISENADAPILDLARERGVPALHIDPGPKPNRMSLAAQKELADRLRAAGVDLVFCGGFLKILKAPMLEAFPRKIINIHPSLLPKHKGLNAAGQALAAGDREAGCTVHYVDAGVDTGEVLGQATVPVRPGDTEEALYARIQQAEFKLLPTVLAQLASAGELHSGRASL